MGTQRCRQRERDTENFTDQILRDRCKAQKNPERQMDKRFVAHGFASLVRELKMKIVTIRVGRRAKPEEPSALGST